jgi:hypothetical protein
MINGTCELLLLGGINSINIISTLFKYEKKSDNIQESEIKVFDNVIQLLGNIRKMENIVYYSKSDI